MGWSNSTFQLLIITASPSGFSGLFVYSPAPGTNNLVDSVASTAGTDPYGNAYQAGVTSYGSGGTTAFAQLAGGILKLQDTAGSNWAVVAFRSAGVPYLAFQASSGVPVKNVFVNQAGFLVAEHPGTLTPETWQAMSPLAAGFTAGTPTPRYRLEPTGSGGVVRLAGQVSLTANHAAGNTFFTLPAAYVPSIVGQQNLPPSSNNLSGFSFNNGYVIVSPGTGTLDMGSAGSTGNVFWLDGLIYSLD